MPLSDVQQKVVLHWGEMGSRWGINRTVAQIHALLFLSQRPLDAEEICETLQLARSNVSTSLRELQGWGIVRLVHVAGDRRDHFEALADFWETFRIILIERRKREWEPTRQFLQNCLDEKQGDDENAFVRERISNMHDFFDTAPSEKQQVPQRRRRSGADKYQSQSDFFYIYFCLHGTLS